MTEPFIQKYTPRYLCDFQLDPTFIDAIKNLMALDFLNLLFIGNIGTGKTAIINALINEYYCPLNNNKSEQINDAQISSNVLYINNLNEQGISYYRSEVKTFCQLQCSIPNKKKILIIDDLDMINIQSQQVFRNCIDSYSSNVNCIASCTNTQKIINSIQSRTTIIRLHNLSIDSQMNIVNNICKKESIEMEDELKKYLVRISDNSISLLINYLEKYKLLNGKMTKQIVDKLSTSISYNIFDIYTNLCKESNFSEAIKLLYSLFDKGYSIIDIFDSYFYYIKQTDTIDEEKKYKIICFISKYITIFYNTHENEIELTIFTKNITDVLSQ